MEFECISTERLILRKLTPEVYDFVYANYTDEELCTFLGLHANDELEREKSKYNLGLKTYNRRFLIFQIIEKRSNAILGWCGFHTWYTDHRRAEIGYVLNSVEYMGKGIMSEAVTSVLDYGFTSMQLNRIEAFVGLENDASTNILKKMGFIKEGILREHYCKNGMIEDSILYALLARDYKR